MVKRTLLVVLSVVLLAVVGFGAYTQLYRPSQQALLTGAPPVRPAMVASFAAHPLTEQTGAEQEQFSAALHDAVAGLHPGHCIAAEQLYVKRDGYSWAALRKLSGQYFDRFGYATSADTQARFDGQTVDYTDWRPHWLQSLFDDRIVTAVALREPRPDSATIVFGYFALRPC